MVSIGCKTEVKAILQNLNVPYTYVGTGTAVLPNALPEGKKVMLKTALEEAGLELLNDKKCQLIEKIKDIINEYVCCAEEPLVINFSVYLSEKLGYDYTYLANLFSETVGVSIERFTILQKIERVKELLVANKLRLTDIARLLHYSSVPHLSTQFKNVTGFSPSHFKMLQKSTPDDRNLQNAI